MSSAFGRVCGRVTSGLLGAVSLSLLAGLLLPVAARATPVTPLLQSAGISRVHELAPLGVDGERIAYIATGSANAYLQNEVELANGDGTVPRRIAVAGRGGFLGLVATTDGTSLLWQQQSLGVSRIWTATTATGSRTLVAPLRLRSRNRLRGDELSVPDYAIAGPSRFYAVFDYGRRVRQLRPGSKRFAPIPVRGGSPRAHVLQQSVARAARGNALALCASTSAHSKRGVRLALLDTTAGVFDAREIAHATPAPLDPHDDSPTPSCAVSDDGSTTAIVVQRTGRRVLVALRHGRLIHVPVPRTTTVVGSISPDGKHALIGYSEFANDDGFSTLQRDFAIVDLDARTILRLRGIVGRLHDTGDGLPFVYGGTTLWSADGKWVAMGAQSGGIFTASLSQQSVHFRPTPHPPVGFLFSKPRVAHPESFTADDRVVFSFYDQSENITVTHPYVAAPDGSGPVTYLLSDSMNSYQGVVRSADGRRVWLMPGSSCHSIFRYPLMSVPANALWSSRFSDPIPQP